MPAPARDLLVSVDALAAELGAAHPPVLLDVRWRLGGPPGIEIFRTGHLPGARYADLDTDLAGPRVAGGRHPLPAPEAFEESMRALGVADGRPVVVYDDGGGVAARAWWDLTYFGHPRVRLLDGGLGAWTAAGRPLAHGDEPAPVRGDFTAEPGHLPVLDADAAAELAVDGVLLDARAGERYRGEVEPVDPVAGHIPGARNAPFGANLGPDGLFRAPAELRAAFAELGVTSAERVGAYCGSGVVASHEVLALQLAGFDPALYVGSWSEWASDPSRPVATGPG